MADGQFESLRLELLRRGVSPLYVERTVVELTDHYADLENAGLAAGLGAEEAARSARVALGNDRAIAAAVLARPELMSFSSRYPRLAQCLHSAAEWGSLPGLPVLFCIEHRPELARWSLAVGAAAALMGSVMAALNWLIVLRY
jgi:hypothetical protein